MVAIGSIIDMDAIGSIIDMDGFNIQGKFYCKELGVLKIDEETAKSYQFCLPFKYVDLKEKDQRSVAYVIKNITKMPLFTINSRPLYQLKDIIVRLYHETNKLPIAYKGGNYEKTLLNELNIPFVDLEKWGCPKAAEIMKDMIWLETCGFHKGADAHLHCSKLEVEAYGRWYYLKMWQQELTR